MPGKEEANGKNSLVGEFLLSLARAPEPVQEAIIIYGLKRMLPFAPELINPYPMLSHMVKILNLGAASGDKGPPTNT
jgi:hypothetical protein